MSGIADANEALNLCFLTSEIQQIRSQAYTSSSSSNTRTQNQPHSSPGDFQDISLDSTTSPIRPSTYASTPSSAENAYPSSSSQKKAPPYSNQNQNQKRDREDLEEWESQQQETIMRQQDTTLNTIGGTLKTLAAQAGLIGQEVGEQSE